MGQGIPGIPRRSDGGSGGDPRSRGVGRSFGSNLGLVNPSSNYRQTLDVEIFDSGVASERGAEIRHPRAVVPHPDSTRILDELPLEGPGYTRGRDPDESENLMLNPSESWEPVFMAYGSRSTA